MFAIPSWHWLTRFGEAQILLPLVLAVAAWLWLGARQGRLALRWLVCIGIAAALTTFTKFAFIGWEWGVADWDFTGISGHAMFSAACLPVLTWVALMGRGERVQRAGVIAALLVAALIAYSRLEVQAHSASESLTGFLLGSAASLITLRGLPVPRPAAVPLWIPAALSACLLVLPLTAPRSRTHDWVTQLSVQLSGRGQPYKRHDLHRKPPPLAPLKATSSSMNGGRSF